VSRNESQNPSAWFAVEVEPRLERSVSVALETKGVEVFLPLYRSQRRWSDRIKGLDLPLFPRCLFVRMEEARRQSVVDSSGVIRIVGPQPIAAAEIRSIRTLTDSGLPLCPIAEPNSVGDRVRILEGPLTGIEGVLESRQGASRLIVSVALLRRSVAVEIERSWAERIEPVKLKARGAALGGER
jgi:transcription antitermination factor NusG